MTDSDEECAECGDPEFDEDGNETHADEEKYDHDFEPEEKLTLDDVKKGADTASSIFKAVKAFKDMSDDSKGYHQTSTPRPPHDEQKRPGVWGRYVLKLRNPKSEVTKSKVEEKLDKIEKKIDYSAKHQNRKWYVGLAIGVFVAIMIAIFV